MQQWQRIMAATLLLGSALAGCGKPNRSATATGGTSTAPFRPSNPGSGAGSGNGNGYAGSGSGRVTNTPGQPPLLPDAQMTPGDTLDVTASDICVPGYSRKVRNVPQSVKRQAYEEYGILTHQPGDFEVDHLISLQLGGSNSLKNLWPQSFKTRPWNAYVKDALENELHAQVCGGKMELRDAQQMIASDWIAAYKRVFRTETPLSKGLPRSLREDEAEGGDNAASAPNANMGTSRSAADSAPVGSGQVWVNLSSGKYWKPGTEYYGKTKRGTYMSEADAVQQGYHAAGSGQ